MFKKLKNKKGFTLIELIIVMVIIGILVLLATPKFLDHVETAKLIQIKNDTKVAEDMMMAKMANDELDFDALTPTDKKEGLNKDSKHISDLESLEGKTYDITKFINSKLPGRFIFNEKGQAVYYDENYKSNTNNNDKMHVKSKDGEWEFKIESFGHSDGYSIEFESWQYTGNDKIVQIPDTIDGEPITSYDFMFKETNVEKVIGNNQYVTSASGMFSGLQSNKLDVSEVDFTNVDAYSYFLEDTNLDEFIINYQQIKPKYAIKMFYNTDIDNIKIDQIDFSEAINVESIFHLSKGQKLDLSNSDFSNVNFASSMFEGIKVEDIIFPIKKMDQIKDIKYMFAGVQREEIDLSFINFNNSPKYNESNERCGDAYVFTSSSVKSITIDANEKDINLIGYRSYILNSSSIKKIYIKNITSTHFDYLINNQQNKGLSEVNLIKVE